MRRALAAAALACVAALTLAGCGHAAAPAPPAGAAPATASPDGKQLGDMQKKVDDAESAASSAESDAAQNN